MSEASTIRCLLVRDGDALRATLALPAGVSVVGASEEAGLRLEAPGVAKQHLLVEVDQKGFTWVTPMRGAKVLVNGQSIDERTKLEVGATLAVGTVSLELALEEWDDSSSDTRVRRSGTHAQGGEVRETIPPRPASAPSILSPGQLVSERYEIIEKLAAGGMGEVYRARHVELGRLFALKVMRAELSADTDFVDRFRREAIASSRIGHPNIVDITDFGRTSEGAFYFVMEHLDGETLTHVIEGSGAQPFERVLHLARQLCSALGAAHAQGIVHRDLKPDNVMVVQRPGAPDLVKVLDFGIAKVDGGFGHGGQTGVGMVVGTPQYMSPEQASGLPVDARSDIYSLGLILYELLVGQPVFEAETAPLLMMLQVSAKPPALPTTVLDVVPPSVPEVLFKMLAKDPKQRPQTMEATLEALERHAPMSLRSSPSPRPSAPRPSPRPSAPGKPKTRTPAPTHAETPSAKSPRAPTPTVREGPPPSVVPGGTALAIEAIRKSRRQRNGAIVAAVVAVALVAVFALSQGRSAPSGAPSVEQPDPLALVPPPAPEVAPKPVEPPAPAPAAGRAEEAPAGLVRLEVKSTPPGANIAIDGLEHGAGPVSVMVKVGRVVKLKATLKGYLPVSREITLDGPRVEELRLSRPTRTASRGERGSGLKEAFDNDLKEIE